MWDAASGLHFLEVPAGEGDKLAKFNFDLGGPMTSSEASSYGGFGIVYVSETVADAGVHTFLHEIGHNIGFKHPFDGDYVLSAADDDFGHTVMSYTSGESRDGSGVVGHDGGDGSLRGGGDRRCQGAHAGQSDAQYIDSLYVAEVVRHADLTGLAAHGETRGDILYETAFGQEHQSHVLSYYDPLLTDLG